MRILDVGSGRTPKLISDYTEIEIVYCDKKFGDDMENLPYPDKSFDIVICINALDHTQNAEKALQEMLRVGQRVYINCAINERSTSRKFHWWDAKPDGLFINPEGEFDLKKYGFEVDFDDGRMMAWYR